MISACYSDGGVLQNIIILRGLFGSQSCLNTTEQKSVYKMCQVGHFHGPPFEDMEK